MAENAFEPTVEEQIALSLSYLAYSGSGIPQHLFLNTEHRILQLIERTLPKIPPLTTQKGDPDWSIVWGPAVYTFKHAKYQDNAMFVAQRISAPTEYVVAIRGTNGSAILDWIEEDLRVFHKDKWPTPNGLDVEGTPKISKATQIGLDALLNDSTPPAGVPGAGLDIEAFLAKIARDGAKRVCFTGHSLGGALAPTLALWFRQSQGITGKWDPNTAVDVSAISFAGPTAGDEDFAKLSDHLLKGKVDRIHNKLDIVPHGWDRGAMETVPKLYEPTIKMSLAEKVLFDGLLLTLNNYEQIERSNPCVWTVQPGEEYDGFFKQAGAQHVEAYPEILKIPELNQVIERL